MLAAFARHCIEFQTSAFSSQAMPTATPRLWQRCQWAANDIPELRRVSQATALRPEPSLRDVVWLFTSMCWVHGLLIVRFVEGEIELFVIYADSHRLHWRMPFACPYLLE